MPIYIDGYSPPKAVPQPPPPAPPPDPAPPAPPPEPPPAPVVPPTLPGEHGAPGGVDPYGHPTPEPPYVPPTLPGEHGTPGGVDPYGQPSPPAPVEPPAPPGEQESYDLDDDPEAGNEPTAEELAYWNELGDAEDRGLELFGAASHPAPGTVIGTPYAVGTTHGKAFNVAHGSDNWQSENAVDVWLYPGTHVLAVLDGVISPGQWGYGLSSKGGRFAGWRLHLVASNGRVFFYTHMQGLNVLKGQQVKAGDHIGDSGIANGVPHLHFAARPPFDPRAFVHDAFTLKGRTSIGTSPSTGGPPAEAPSAPALETAWQDLMRVFGLGLPAASSHIRDARRALGPAVT